MRASNLMIGTTTLAVIAAAFAGLLAVQKLRSAQQRSPIRIVFDGSASGLRRGGAVNFDGIQAGEIVSIKLESPRKIVVLARLDNSAPIRKDTVVGIEFQGLTGIAAISLVGGAPAAPPVPLDEDGIPILTADLSEQESITDTLHNVDRVIVSNEEALKDALLSFETYTASLKSKGEAIDAMIDKADNAFAGFDGVMSKIEGVVPGLADGRPDELFQKVQSLRELADTFKQKSATLIEEGRRTLLDISQGAQRMDRKFVPQAAGTVQPPQPAPPRKPQQQRP
jgi:phospholipid/cholesterol/gamma-HCH transport system substrate-binding protein